MAEVVMERPPVNALTSADWFDLAEAMRLPVLAVAYRSFFEGALLCQNLKATGAGGREAFLGDPTEVALAEMAAAAITEDGWFRTGDLGKVDAEGYVFVEDRLKDMIITGGENVYSPEVERVLAEHPAVAEVAVIGVPHDRWGETVKAVVSLHPGQSATEEELIAFCRESLAKFKCPRSVDVLEALPRNPTGKILKRELRRPYWDGRDRAVN